MYARTSTWIGTQDALDKWADLVATTVAPMVAELPGNRNAYFLLDRASGRALTVTLWDTEEAALASDATADQSRDRTAAATGVTLADRGRYTVVQTQPTAG